MYVMYISHIQKSLLYSVRLTAIAKVSNMNSLTNAGLIEEGNIVVKLWRRLLRHEREREREGNEGGKRKRETGRGKERDHVL